MKFQDITVRVRVEGDHGLDYDIAYNAHTGHGTCTCLGFYYSRTQRPCKHLRFLANALAPEETIEALEEKRELAAV